MSELWAIAAYFNPMGYRRRRSNYDLFRQHLEAPLLTVELGYGGAFELDDDDADILVRVPAKDVMWQKERLLNLAVAALPGDCTKVAWLDADLVFESGDWAGQTATLLDHHALVQPFASVRRMAAGWRPLADAGPGGDTLDAVARQLAKGKSIEACLAARGEASGTAVGMGWAARRELLQAHGLYDANILGDGDSLLVHAAFGLFAEAVAQQKMTSRRERHFRAWAEPFFAAIQGRVACASGRVAHLWHGSIADRRYAERIEGLLPFGYDPDMDIIHADGAWEWNSSKTAMHDFVRRYFSGRREDGRGGMRTEDRARP